MPARIPEGPFAGEKALFGTGIRTFTTVVTLFDALGYRIEINKKPRNPLFLFYLKKPSTSFLMASISLSRRGAASLSERPGRVQLET
jgi:hypothetical protein